MTKETDNWGGKSREARREGSRHSSASRDGSSDRERRRSPDSRSPARDRQRRERDRKERRSNSRGKERKRDKRRERRESSEDGEEGRSGRGRDDASRERWRRRSSSPESSDSSASDHAARAVQEKEEKSKQKEMMKALETPEEKRARRLAKKEAKEKKRREKMGWSEEYMGYTNADNPFGDNNLLGTFKWQKVSHQAFSRFECRLYQKFVEFCKVQYCTSIHLLFLFCVFRHWIRKALATLEKKSLKIGTNVSRRRTAENCRRYYLCPVFIQGSILCKRHKDGE